MKALYVTKEMQKYQESARKAWEMQHPDYVDAVFVGWNLRPGSVIAWKNNQGADCEVEIVKDDNSGLLDVIANGKAGQTTKAKTATVILSRNVTVYYSR